MKITQLKPSDKIIAAGVLARSFYDYPLFTYYWPDPKRRSRYFQWYCGCILNYGLKFAEVYTTPEVRGISIWFPPGKTQITTWRYVRSGFLLLPIHMGARQFFEQTMKAEDMVSQIHRELMPGNHWYLWVLAVDPGYQHQGIGTTLMQPGLENADAQRLPCYLETCGEKNVSFYQKRGFDVALTKQIQSSDLSICFLIRKPTN
jgi:ribosomal protein S18 acetylase RimI-like enzyme